MSKDNVKQMFGKMEKDAELQKKYAALMQAHQKESEKALTDKLVELGKSSGFAFSKDDLISAREEFVDKINENKELADGDLANVAGGDAQSKQQFALISVATLGFACALLVPVLSVDAYYIKKSGNCEQALSLTVDCKIPK